MIDTELRFCSNLESSQVASELPNFKPHSFPPSDDFFVSVDKDGNALSQYSDTYWDFSAYGYYGFNFKIQKLTPENNDLLKQLVFLYLYHMPIFPGKVTSVLTIFSVLCKLCKFADSHNITVDQLYRFPHLTSKIIEYVRPAQHSRLIGVLNSLLRSENILGWKIADSAFIQKLAKLQIPHIPMQNAYIPPRIWGSLIQTSEIVMDEFEKHQDSFEEAWIWLYEAYRNNIENGYNEKSPFNRPGLDTKYRHSKKSLKKPRRVYPGGTKAFFEDHCLMDLLSRWIGYTPDKKRGTHILSAYVNLVRDCAFLFILAHSIQRRGEGLSLRSDCFLVDEDPTLGKVAFLIGETTKTDPDNDARWVVPMSVKRPVKILNFLANLRLNTSSLSVDPEIKKNPYLMTGQLEYWGSGTKVSGVKEWDLKKLVENNPLAFPSNNFTIKEEDYNVAYQLTPCLKGLPWFKVGKQWSFNSHQLRRTLAVNLFASDIPHSIIQWQMKHKTVNQSFYYGRNYTRLRVNANAERTVVAESYRTTIRNLIEASKNSLGDYVHPTGKKLIGTNTLKLIKERDHKKLEALVKKGEIVARPTLLGFCMTQSCEYGGVESAVHCAGVDGNGPCKDAIFSKKNNKRLKVLFDSNSKNLKDQTENTPKHSKLKIENEAIEVYFHATSQER